MPRRTDPNSRLTLVLACDQYLPPESQPKFFARVLSVRQAEELQEKREHGGRKSLAVALEVLMMFLTGWENMTHPDTGASLDFNVENLKDVLTIDELHEVIDFAIGSIAPSAGDQKKSESPPS
jgi:hypothetical protein